MQSLSEFEQVVEHLIEMQRRGAPILTPPNILRLFPDNFRGKKAPEEVMPCRVGMRDFFIRTDGKVEVCVHYPTNRKHPRAKRARYLVWAESTRNSEENRRMRSPLLDYMPLAKDAVWTRSTWA